MGPWCRAGSSNTRYGRRCTLAGLRTRTARRRAALVGRVALLELSPRVLARALDAFPGRGPLRTLDALHLASCAYLADQGQDVELASYDRRMNDVASAMDIPLVDPEGS